MFRKAVPFIALAAGAGGFLLRREQLLTVFDAETGFAEKNAPVSVALLVLSAAVFVSAVVFAVLQKDMTAGKCEKTFRVGKGGLLAYEIFGLVLAVSSAGWVIRPVFSSAVNTVVCILSLASAVAAMVFGGSMHRGEPAGGLSVIGAAPSLFCCFLLALLYKTNSGNPQILEFGYEALALAAGAVAFYYVEGYVCGRPNPRTALAANLCAVYFLGVSAAGFGNSAEKLAAVCMAGLALVNSVLLLRDRPEPEEPDEPEETEE